MSDQDGTQGLDREAAKHYRLGNLLRKERSELKARQVQAVVHENLPIEEKISRINVIDMRPEPENQAMVPVRRRTGQSAQHLGHMRVLGGGHKSTEPTPGSTSEVPKAASSDKTSPSPATVPVVQTAGGDGNRPVVRDPRLALTANERRQLKGMFGGEARLPHPALQQAARNRLRNLREPEHGGLLRFLLSEYRRIRRFGTESKTLEPAGWPFTLRFSPAVPVFIDKTLKHGFLDVLGKALPQILHKGWMFMERIDYNMLAMLQAMVTVGRKLEYRDTKAGVEPVFSSFTPLVSYILVFQSGEGMVSKLVQTFTRACERTGVEIELQSEGNLAIRTMLDLGGTGLTLPNLVRAIWMRRTHRFLYFQDLGTTGSMQRYLSDAAYDCTPEVQAEIDRHLSQLVSRLDNLDLERLEIDRWRAFLPAPQLVAGSDPAAPAYSGFLDPGPGALSNLVDWSGLRSFYSGHTGDESFDLDTDRTIPLLQIVRFLDHYLRLFEPLLVSGVRLQSDTRAEILQKGLFATQITKLVFLHERLQELVIAMPHLGQAKFTDLVAGVSGNDQEKLMAARVQDLASVLTSLGKAIADIIRNRSALADLAIRGGQADPPAYPLPNEGELLMFPEGLAGKTVLSGLLDAASLALLEGMMLVPGEMALLLGREVELKRQLEPVREGLTRLATDEQLAELQAAYPRLLASSKPLDQSNDRKSPYSA